MIKRSFIGLAKPLIEYQALDVTPLEPQEISTPKKVTLFIDRPYNHRDSILFNIGDQVKTGQKLSYSEDNDAYVISTVTGTISSISSFIGDYGKAYTAISIDVDENEETDDQFKELIEDPTLDTASNYLSGVPGNPCFKIFSDPERPINTIIVSGVDCDLLITTNQYVVKAHINAINNGVSVLKKITGIDNILIAVPENLMQDAVASGAEVRTVDSEYPSALPVASIGKAFNEGGIPVTKTLTFIDKNGEKTLVSARIGTPVSEIIKAFNVTLNEQDRIIFGGPMTGSSIYSEDYPVQADTDAIIVQDKDSLALVSEYPCINCGECVRICPVNVPVNMLVRFLEAGKYEEAAEEYDLYSCIECGLCSFVCVSKMPVFHYIKLAKYELGRISIAEATNA